MANEKLWSIVQEALQRQTYPAESVLDALDALAAGDALPSPWAMWTLIGLARHRERQRWVESIVRRLGSDPDALATLGAGGHPHQSEEEEPVPRVPGAPEWQYFFHGCGCCLTHNETGESIDVDFYDDTAEHFDPWFYAKYLRSLRAPEPAEARLIALHPSRDTAPLSNPVALAMDELAERGLLISHPEREDIRRLSDDAIAHAAALCALAERWCDPAARPAVAMLLGDWLAAHEIATSTGDARSLTIIGPRLTRVLDSRRARLLALLARDTQGAPLMALVDLDPPDVVEHLRRALEPPFCAKTSTAMNVIDARDDPAFAPDILALFVRLDPAGAASQPHLWTRCSAFLLRHRHHIDEVVATFPSVAEPLIGEAALLALEHAPLLVRPLLRRALRSRVQYVRITGAALLALLDVSWCRDELAEALEDIDDHELVAECLAALRVMGDAEGRGAAWEAKHPGPPPRDRDGWLRSLMEQHRAHVERSRRQEIS